MSTLWKLSPPWNSRQKSKLYIHPAVTLSVSCSWIDSLGSKTLNSQIIINHDHPITLSSNLTKRSNKELQYYCGWWTVVPECHMNRRNWGLQQALAYKKKVLRKGSTEPTDNYKKWTIAKIRIWNSHGFQNTSIFKPFKKHHVICIVKWPLATARQTALANGKPMCDCKAPIIHRRKNNMFVSWNRFRSKR